MKNKKILFPMLIIFASLLGAQEIRTAALKDAAPAPTAKNSLYWELLGNGHFFSLNIERRLGGHAALRVGWGVTGGLVMGSVLAGRRDHWLEIGFGPSFGKDNDNRFTLLTLNFTCGYRYLKPRGGLLLRAGFTPVIYLKEIQNNAFTVHTNRLTPRVGVSIGYAF